MIDKEIMDLIKSKIRDSPSGISAVYIQIYKEWGLKLFSSNLSRDLCHKRQKICHKAGWAPKAGAKIDIEISPDDKDLFTIDNNVHQFGYLTEHLFTLPNTDSYNHGLCADLYKLAEEEINEWKNKYEDKIDIWFKEIKEKTGWYFYDRHMFNWGRTKEGKWVPIDFGG